MFHKLNAESGAAVRCSAWLGASSVHSLVARCNDLLWFWRREVNDEVVKKHGGNCAGNKVSTGIRAGHHHLPVIKSLTKLCQVIADSAENLQLPGALLGIGVSLGKPTRHELSWRQSVNIGGVVMLERLRKLGVWI